MDGRLLTTIGLAVEVVGVGLLAWGTGVLVNTPGTMGGIIPQEVRDRVRWPTRIGWLCLGAGMIAQAFAVWL